MGAWRRAITVLMLAFLAAVVGLILPVGGTVSAAGCLVTSTADGGAGSLRAAIDQTDNFSGCDTINFNLPDLSTITLTSGSLNITRNLTITGPGADKLTISGNNASRVFYIASSTVAISGVTLANGRENTGAGGGAMQLNNNGTLT